MKNINILIFSLLISFSCKKKDPEVAQDIKKLYVENYATIVYASYQDAYTKAQDLKQAASLFLAAPDQTKFAAVKNAWLAARVPYEQTEAYRFYGGPIDDDNGPEGLMNSWPMDEAFIDYVKDDASSGIINNSADYPSITLNLIDSLNTLGGETEVSCGYHAIEFLLWGQDFNPNGPGARPYTDYVSGAGGTASNQTRRGQYLIAAIDLLSENLAYLVDAWKPGSSNYRATFVNDPQGSLSLLLTGMGKFAKGELAGERMSVALGTHEQEDEHSCFSDNTVNDIILGQKSISNVYYGTYTRSDGTVIDGTGLDDLLKKYNTDLNTKMVANLSAATTAAGLIPPPFDQDILAGNPGGPKVLDAITAISAEADELVEAAAALGITLLL